MSYVSFTNSPASAKLSVAVGREASASFGKRGLTVLLISAAATEFIFVAIAAYFAAALYQWLILLFWPESAKYIPEALLIATLNLLVSLGHRQYNRIQTQPRHTFLWNGVHGVFLVFFFFLSMMFVLKISEGYSRATVMVQAASVGLAVLCARTIWFSLLQRAIASGLVDARRVILIGDPEHCVHFAARAMATGIRTIRSFELLTAPAPSSVHAGPTPSKSCLIPAS